MNARRLVGVALVATLVVAGGAGAQPDLPAPAGAVNDVANLLSDADERTLAFLVQEVEDATTAEIAVATVPSLDGRTVEEYATALFAAWGIGQAEQDNGVLILVAPTERAMRIEVGYGLEEVLPDGLAGQIIRETFLPAFRDGDYRRGILEGTQRVAAIVRRNQPLTPAERDTLAAAEQGYTDEAIMPFVLVPFLGLFVSIGFGLAGAGAGARAAVPILFGLVFGGVPLLISFAAGMPTGAWVLCGVALLTLAAGVAIGRRPDCQASLRGPGTSRGGRWVWGGAGSSGRSGSSGSSRSSGGFGGGSSGGGGASGRW